MGYRRWCQLCLMTMDEPGDREVHSNCFWAAEVVRSGHLVPPSESSIASSTAPSGPLAVKGWAEEPQPSLKEESDIPAFPDQPIPEGLEWLRLVDKYGTVEIRQESPDPRTSHSEVVSLRIPVSLLLSLLAWDPTDKGWRNEALAWELLYELRRDDVVVAA